MKPGDVLADRFEIRQEIGRGGLAHVYAAHDRTLDQDVALKVLMPHLAEQRVIRERFRREVALSRSLVHPSIVRVYDLFETDDHTFFTMDLLACATLKEQLRHHGPAPAVDRRRVVVAICDALAAAHALGIVHRDIKPHNVMRLPDGEIRVLDFGLARVESMAGLTANSVLMGTPEYMAPETAAGLPVDGRADLYSLGVLWFELATGELPFSSRSPLEHFKRISEEDGPAPSGADVSPTEAAIVQRLLRHRPEDRFASATEVIEALDAGALVPGKGRCGPTRICTVCGAEEPAGTAFCLSCGADRRVSGSTHGRAMLVLRRFDPRYMTDDPPDLTDLMARFGLAPNPLATPGDATGQRLLLKDVDVGYARAVQSELLKHLLTCEIRDRDEECFDLLHAQGTPSYVFVGGLLLGWAALCFIGWLIGGPAGLIAALIWGPPLGLLLRRKTQLFLVPGFVVTTTAPGQEERDLANAYRAFLEEAPSAELRKIGASLMTRAFALLALLGDLELAPAAIVEFRRSTVESALRGLEALDALRPVETYLGAADTRQTLEDLERAEALVRSSSNPQEREQATELATTHAGNLRRQADVEHERTRRIQGVLKLVARMESTRTELLGLGLREEEQLSRVGRRLEVDAQALAAAQAELEALVR